MPTGYFRFYEELNDFLPAGRRRVEFAHPFPETSSLKDIIEALGVPHPEVDLVLVNGQSADFAFRPAEGDRVSVYPVFESFDIQGVTRLRPEPLRDLKFILDVHLGRLASLLRLLGLDALYRNDYEDRDLALLAQEEKRVILTRDRGLLKRKIVERGYWVRATDPARQAPEVVERFQLRKKIAPFSRCLRCNGLLQPADKAAVYDELPPKVQQRNEVFHRCAACRRIYWEGTHLPRLQELIREMAG
jgi:uncharacterized protein